MSLGAWKDQHCGTKWLDGLLDKAIYAVAVDSPESAAAVGASAVTMSVMMSPRNRRDEAASRSEAFFDCDIRRRK